VRPPQGIPDRRLQVEAVSQGLKEMALVCKVPVLCLTSLRRPQTPGARPTMADLKESGELEHDADVIVLMHRDDKPDEPPNTIVELHVAKNRDGETGRRDLVFSPQFVSFASRITRGHDGADAS
jgi:replicative DNA helicase